MPTIESRLQKLEQAAGADDGLCTCDTPPVVLWGGDEPPPGMDVCPHCGRKVRDVTVVWIEEEIIGITKGTAS
jgi:hypothetical protein